MTIIKLTDNFFLHEFTRSETAARLGKGIKPSITTRENITRLCHLVLQPLRGEVKASIHITSGYRPLWLNKLVGGSAKSQHTKGLAADFIVAGMPPLIVCLLINTLRLPFDQLIYEFGEWTHVSVAPVGEKPRGVILTATKVLNPYGIMRTVYTHGLPTQQEDR